MNEHASTPERLRWGVLGPGDVAGTFTRALARSPGAVCVAVGSRSAGRAASFAAEHGLERAYGSYEQLMADPEVDIVYVASPQSVHHSHARLALERGKGVLVEKPMTMSRAEADDLVALSSKHGLFLMEGLWTLCHPLVRSAVELVRSGALGELESFTAVCGPLPLPHGHRALDAAAGGGFYREVLIYPLAIWSALTDLTPIADVHATGRTDGGADYAATATVTTADGRYTTVAGAFSRGVIDGATSPARLLLDDGWAELDDTFAPTRLRVVSGDRTDDQSLEGEAAGTDFDHEIAEVVAAVTAGHTESTSVPHALSLHLADLLDRVAYQLHPTSPEGRK
jgi:predicted dehydrogenase